MTLFYCDKISIQFVRCISMHQEAIHCIMQQMSGWLDNWKMVVLQNTLDGIHETDRRPCRRENYSGITYADSVSHIQFVHNLWTNYSFGHPAKIIHQLRTNLQMHSIPAFS